MGQDSSSAQSRKSIFSGKRTDDIDRTPAFFVTVGDITKRYDRTNKKKNGRAIFSYDSINSIQWVSYGNEKSWILSWDGRFKYLNDFEERMSQKLADSELKGHWWRFSKTKNDWDWRYTLNARVVSVSRMLEVTRALVSMFEDFGLGQLMANIVIDMLDECRIYEMLRKRKKILVMSSIDVDDSKSRETGHLRNTSDIFASTITTPNPFVRDMSYSY